MGRCDASQTDIVHRVARGMIQDIEIDKRSCRGYWVDERMLTMKAERQCVFVAECDDVNDVNLNLEGSYVVKRVERSG